MKDRTLLTIAALVALLVIAGLAGRARTRLTAATAAAQRTQLGDEAKLRQAQERLGSARAQVAAQAAKRAASPAPTETSPAKPEPGATRFPTIAERLRTEPDAQVLWLDLERHRAAMAYQPAFRKLGLTPDQVATFIDNVVRKREQQMDLQAIATEERTRSGAVSAETSQALARVDTEYQAAQRALLGDEAYRQLQDYDRTTYVRNWVDGWAGGATAYLGEPLTRDQGEQLLQAIANASANYRSGGSAAGSIDWGTVDAAAQRILTPNQYRFFATTEPPLPYGGRAQSMLYEKINAASALETRSPP